MRVMHPLSHDVRVTDYKSHEHNNNKTSNIGSSLPHHQDTSLISSIEAGQQADSQGGLSIYFARLRHEASVTRHDRSLCVLFFSFLDVISVGFQTCPPSILRGSMRPDQASSVTWLNRRTSISSSVERPMILHRKSSINGNPVGLSRIMLASEGAAKSTYSAYGHYPTSLAWRPLL